jgi:hypothetical protein
LTRGLRARLGYASYKATHNLSASTLRDLEARTPSQPVSYPRPNTFPPPTSNIGGNVLVRKGSMGPPPPVTASAGQSLFASLLGPPPAKRARTIRNPQDPHVPAPVRPFSTASPSRRSVGSERARTNVHTSVAERTRSHARAPKRDVRKKPRAKKGKGKEDALSEVDDIKAAATLTSLLMHSRPGTMAGSSPRSSTSGKSDSRSAYPHFAQSSTRANNVGVVSGDPSGLSKTPSPPGKHDGNSRTPRPKRGAGGTPGSAPTDSEAAELMMFLATSPSPARPNVNRDRDAEAYRMLGGGASGLKGRVLFSTAAEGDARFLSREATRSFASTDTVVNDELTNTSAPLTREATLVSPGPSPTSTLVESSQRDGTSQKTEDMMNVELETYVTPPTPTSAAQLPALLPPSISPTTSPTISPNPPRTSRSAALYSGFDANRPFDVFPAEPRQNSTPHTPGNISFNLNEFINVSPSPATPRGSMMPPPRVDIGRKLFSDEHAMKEIVGPDGGGRSANSSSEHYLGPGIDFVRT